MTQGAMTDTLTEIAAQRDVLQAQRDALRDALSRAVKLLRRDNPWMRTEDLHELMRFDALLAEAG